MEPERSQRELEDINPALAAIAETRAERRIGTSLLDTYLGLRIPVIVIGHSSRR